MSNIQKLFSEKIEIFSAVEFSKVSILTGIIKITLKVRIIMVPLYLPFSLKCLSNVSRFYIFVIFGYS